MIDDSRQPAEPEGRVPGATRAAAEGVFPWALAGDGVPARATGMQDGPLSADRVAELRRRILRGTYNTTEVLEVVARRLLASGDLQSP